MREAVGVALTVVATDLLLRLVGLWSWIASSTLGRWAWLMDRYALMFPVMLLTALLAVRKWSPARSNLLGAGLSGAAAGFVTSLLAFALAQVITDPERASSLSGLRLESGLTGFLLFGSGLALFRALGWLYGSLASILALLIERGEQLHERSSELAHSRIWLWTLVVLVLVAAAWSGNLTLANWWASGGPPTPDPEVHAERGHLFFELTALLLLVAILLVTYLRRKIPSKPGGTPRFLALTHLALLMGSSFLGCGSARTASGGYFSSLDYQAREALSQSLPAFRLHPLTQRIRYRGDCLTQPDIDELVRLGGQLNGFAGAANTARRVVGRPGSGSPWPRSATTPEACGCSPFVATPAG